MSQRHSQRSLDGAELAERNPGSPGPDENQRSLDEAEPAERNPGSFFLLEPPLSAEENWMKAGYCSAP